MVGIAVPPSVAAQQDDESWLSCSFVIVVNICVLFRYGIVDGVVSKIVVVLVPWCCVPV